MNLEGGPVPIQPNSLQFNFRPTYDIIWVSSRAHTGTSVRRRIIQQPGKRWFITTNFRFWNSANPGREKHRKQSLPRLNPSRRKCLSDSQRGNRRTAAGWSHTQSENSKRSKRGKIIPGTLKTNIGFHKFSWKHIRIDLVNLSGPSFCSWSPSKPPPWRCLAPLPASAYSWTQLLMLWKARC